MEPDKLVLSDISFICPQGEPPVVMCTSCDHTSLEQDAPLIAVVGPVGAGKVVLQSVTGLVILIPSTVQPAPVSVEGATSSEW